MEVGPLARALVAYARGNARVKTAVDATLAKANLAPAQLDSVLGRHVARAIECKLIAERCMEWANQVIPGAPTCAEMSVPRDGHGYGLVEAPRGALGHWMTIAERQISHYQCIVPTTWNCSPRDDSGVPGPIEQALVGVPVADDGNPVEAAIVVRSFDPCIACAVH
jgi:ferredoxin hydrogenase large subunit/hydrogenase large subunit